VWCVWLTLDVPRDKNLGVLSKENEQAMLSVHLVLSVVLKSCSRIPEMQEENVVERSHA
jgi:hypothetical protein